MTAKRLKTRSLDEEIVDWSPPMWYCNCFPLTQADQTCVTLSELIAVLERHADTASDADTTALQAVLHVAHILVTLQGADGLWPESLDLRTGKGLTQTRSAGPLKLFRRLNEQVGSTEFDSPCRHAEAGIAVLTV